MNKKQIYKQLQELDQLIADINSKDQNKTQNFDYDTLFEVNIAKDLKKIKAEFEDYQLPEEESQIVKIPKKEFINELIGWFKDSNASVQAVNTSTLKNCVVNSKAIIDNLNSIANKSDNQDFVKDVYKAIAIATPSGDHGTVTVDMVATSWGEALGTLNKTYRNLTTKRKDRDKDGYVPKKEIKDIDLGEDVSNILDQDPLDGIETNNYLSNLLDSNIDRTHFSYIKTTKLYNDTKDTFKRHIKDWCDNLGGEFAIIIDTPQSGDWIYRSLLEKNRTTISDGDELTEDLKMRIINAAESAASTSTTNLSVTIARSAKAVSDKIKNDDKLAENLWEKYLENTPDLSATKVDITFSGPSNFGEWLTKAIKPNLTTKFVDKVKEWVTVGDGKLSIDAFETNSKAKYFSKVKMKSNFKAILCREHNGIKLDSMLFDRLMKDIGNVSEDGEEVDLERGSKKDQVSISKFNDLWQKAIKELYEDKKAMEKFFLDQVYPKNDAYEHLDAYVDNVSFDALPSEHTIIEACKRSLWFKKAEPKYTPVPPPKPRPNENLHVLFKDIPYESIEIAILKKGKEISFTQFPAGTDNYIIGKGLPPGEYEIHVRFLQINKSEPLTDDQRKVLKNTVKKVNQIEGILCILTYLENKTYDREYSVKLPFIPIKAVAYSLYKGYVIETKGITSKEMKGGVNFFLDLGPNRYENSNYMKSFPFYVRFIGSGVGDDIYSDHFIKDHTGSCIIKYEVEDIYEPVGVIFPYDPIKAWLSHSNKAEGAVIPNTMVPLIPTDKNFEVGVGLPGGSYFLHLVGAGSINNEHHVEEVHKQYSSNFWNVSLYNPEKIEMSNKVDYYVLRNDLLDEMGSWTDQFLKALSSKIMGKFDKDYDKAQQKTIDWWGALDAIIAIIPVEAVAKGIDIAMKVTKVVINAIEVYRSNTRGRQDITAQKLVDDLYDEVILYTQDKYRTQTIAEQNNLLTAIINEHSDKTTNQLSGIVRSNIKRALPDINEMLKPVQELLDKYSE